MLGLVEIGTKRKRTRNIAGTRKKAHSCDITSHHHIRIRSLRIILDCVGRFPLFFRARTPRTRPQTAAACTVSSNWKQQSKLGLLKNNTRKQRKDDFPFRRKGESPLPSRKFPDKNPVDAHRAVERGQSQGSAASDRPPCLSGELLTKLSGNSTSATCGLVVSSTGKFFVALRNWSREISSTVPSSAHSSHPGRIWWVHTGPHLTLPLSPTDCIRTTMRHDVPSKSGHAICVPLAFTTESPPAKVQYLK